MNSATQNQATQSNATPVPQDSVLRRHWEAANSMASSAPAENNSPSAGGFFSWLKSLFN